MYLLSVFLIISLQAGAFDSHHYTKTAVPKGTQFHYFTGTGSSVHAVGLSCFLTMFEMVNLLILLRVERS